MIFPWEQPSIAQVYDNGKIYTSSHLSRAEKACIV
jgi:hypothetical protein